MRVGVVKRGKYGERLVDVVQQRTEFDVVEAAVPEGLPGFIEDPEEFLKELHLDEKVFDADIMILYTFHPDLTPEIVKEAGKHGVKAVIIPGGMGRAGSIGELEKIAREYDIYIEVDEICCTLEECGNETVDGFARRLGRPDIDVDLSKDGRISGVKVIRGSPCGSTWHMAEGLIGKTVGEAPALAGLLCQQYPCRAVRGTPGGIHTSGDLHKDAMERALGMKTDLKLPAQSRPVKIEGKKGVRKDDQGSD